MRTIETPIFKFSELSDKAKEAAKEYHYEACGYSWSVEARKSLAALAEHFNGKLDNWSIDWQEGGLSWARFMMLVDDLGESVAEQTAEIERLLELLGSYNPDTQKGNGDCVLTGFSSDEDAIDGFRLAFHGGERDLNKLMQAAFTHWLKACQAYCKSQYEDEAFAETCDANEYEFFEDGKMYHAKL
jgi:hypothetical protein